MKARVVGVMASLVLAAGAISLLPGQMVEPARAQMGEAAKKPTKTPKATLTPTRTPTRTPTKTVKPTKTLKPTKTAKPTKTVKPTKTPKPTKTLKPTKSPKSMCDPAYPGVCIAPPPPDLDCKNIPYRFFKVLPPDPHNFDGDGDGWGCEG